LRTRRRTRRKTRSKEVVIERVSEGARGGKEKTNNGECKHRRIEDGKGEREGGLTYFKHP
jgi:hypothetical protein